jgi:hypothetical protein
VPAYHLSDVSERNTLIGYAVISTTGGTFFKRQPVETSGIQPVHSGPVIEPIPHVRRNALFTRNGKEVRNEAVITVSMHRWRKAYRGHAHATRR